MERDTLTKVGELNPELSEILGYNINKRDVYISTGLKAHMIKRKHFKCLKYLESMSDIINNPDYIGINPNEKSDSIELVKRYDDNVLVGIKIDPYKDYLYIATMHDIQDSKLSRRVHSGRLKEVVIDNKSKD